MRIGTSSSGRWWVSMGPVGWLLYLIFALPVMAAWYALRLLVWLAELAAQAITEHRAARALPGRSPSWGRPR